MHAIRAAPSLHGGAQQRTLAHTYRVECIAFCCGFGGRPSPPNAAPAPRATGGGAPDATMHRWTPPAAASSVHPARPPAANRVGGSRVVLAVGTAVGAPGEAALAGGFAHVCLQCSRLLPGSCAERCPTRRFEARELSRTFADPQRVLRTCCVATCTACLNGHAFFLELQRRSLLVVVCGDDLNLRTAHVQCTGWCCVV